MYKAFDHARNISWCLEEYTMLNTEKVFFWVRQRDSRALAKAEDDQTEQYKYSWQSQF